MATQEPLLSPSEAPRLGWKRPLACITVLLGILGLATWQPRGGNLRFQWGQEQPKASELEVLQEDEEQPEATEFGELVEEQPEDNEFESMPYVPQRNSTLESLTHLPSSVAEANRLFATNPARAKEQWQATSPAETEALFSDYLMTFGSHWAVNGSFESKDEHLHRLQVFKQTISRVIDSNIAEHMENPSIHRPTFGITSNADWNDIEWNDRNIQEEQDGAEVMPVTQAVEELEDATEVELLASKLPCGVFVGTLVESKLDYRDRNGYIKKGFLGKVTKGAGTRVLVSFPTLTVGVNLQCTQFRKIGYGVGNSVISRLNYASRSGKIVKGDVGKIVGPASGATASGRVIVKFPTMSSVNLLPSQFAWVQSGVAKPYCSFTYPDLGPAISQGTCGNCYAHATDSTLRTAYWKKYGRDPGYLSTEFIADCFGNKYYGNVKPGTRTCNNGLKPGCCGGRPGPVLNMIKSQGGVPTTRQYGPEYTITKPKGPIQQCKKTAKALTTTGPIYPKTEFYMSKLICTNGGVAVAINFDSFRDYTGGVMTQARCKVPSLTSVTHAIELVGMDVNHPSGPVWVLRNSHGPNWGVMSKPPYGRSTQNKGGYFLLAYGQNACNLRSWGQAAAAAGVTKLR